MNILDFSKSYWEYYLELERRMEETRRYVEYDEVNSRTYSSNYLMIFQAVCSEIDVVGKEIAEYFNSEFRKGKDKSKTINRWWYEIQDQLPNVYREVSFANSFSLKPWDRYRVDKKTSQRFIDGEQKNVTNYNLQAKADGITYQNGGAPIIRSSTQDSNRMEMA